MATFDSQLLRRFQYLSLVARRAAERSLVAGPRKTLPGGGTEVSGLRDYAPGDDYRYIDWAWCARRDELLTKTFEGDEDLHVYILLDCSPSMGLGRPPKFQLARQVAAVLGYAALTNLDRLSVAAFSDGIVDELPPIRHRQRIPRLLQFLNRLSPADTQTKLAQTNLTRTAEGLVRRYQRHGPVVVISDLYDRNGFQRGFDILRHGGYEPRLVQIHDPTEARAELLGDVELFDVETASAQRVTVTERAAQRYAELFAEFRRSVRSYCGKYGVPCVQIAGDAPEDEVLLTVLGARAAMTEISSLSENPSPPAPLPASGARGERFRIGT